MARRAPSGARSILERQAEKLGRKSRQSRRAHERREAQRRKSQPAKRKGPNWSVIGGGAIVGIAIVALIVVVIIQNQSNKAAAEPPGKTIAGMQCDKGMNVAYHVHTHLDIYDGNKLHPIPPYVGFNLSHDCLYWLHTHSYSPTYPASMDMIHLESPYKVTPTLGDFFAVWGKPLSRHEVYNIKLKKGQTMRVTVDGKLYTGNPRNIPIKSHQNVTIAVGPPFHKPTPFNFDAYDRAHPGNGF